MPLPIPEPRESGTTSTTDIPLYWVRYGAVSHPKLIILHGGPGADHRYLLPQLLHLAERYEILLYDQRGSGRSRAENNAPITWQNHVTDLGRFCQEMHIAHPSLVGYSWGGMLSLLYAIQALDDPTIPAPARLALISPAPVNKAYRQVFDEQFRQRSNAPAIVAERAALMASGLRESDPDAYRQRIFELGVAGYFADPAEAHDLTPFRVVGRVQQSTWDSLGDYDLLPSLQRLRLPTKIVHGRDDPIPVASSIDAARVLGTDVTVLDRCGHVPYIEAPDQLWTALDPFLESTDPIAA